MNLIGTTIIVITTNAIDSEIWPRLVEIEGNTFIWSVSAEKQFSRVSRLVSAPQKKIRYVTTYTERGKLPNFHIERTHLRKFEGIQMPISSKGYV